MPPLPARLLAALLAIAGISLPAGTVHGAITVTRTVEANTATEIKAGRPDVRYGWRISNDGPGVEPEATLVVRTTLSDPGSACASASGCTLGWRLDGQPVAPNTPVRVPLGAYQSHELTYEGRAEDLGLYQSRAVISQPAPAVPTIIDIRVRRALPQLGADAIDLGPIGRQTLPLFGRQLPQPVPVTIVNGSIEPVTLAGAARARLLRDDGSGSFDNLVLEDETGCPGLGSGVTIKPGGRLSCSLPVQTSIGPGRYRLSLSVGGANKTADFSLRYHWFYAWLTLLLGGIAGAWLASYQGSARRRALQLADAQDLLDRAEKIHDGFDPGAADARKVVQDILVDLRSKIPLLRASRTADFGPQIEAVTARLPAIGAFGALEKEYRALPASSRPKAAYDAAFGAVSAAPLPADAAQKLKELKDAIDAAREIRESQATPTDVNASDLFPMILPPRSSTKLRAWVSRNDRLIALATILLAATLGVATLWKGDATWGDIGDILLALFTGLAATVTGTLTIRELVSGYQLGRLPGR